MASNNDCHANGEVNLQCSVVDLFSKSVKEAPDQIAISAQDSDISYQKLDNASSLLAWTIRGRGVGPGDQVPVVTSRCPEMAVCLLGILKLGACYVPIDLDSWSAERIQTTLAIVNSRVVVTTGVKAYPPYSMVYYQSVQDDVCRAAEDFQLNLQYPLLRPLDISYIIFTSGTTSAPKGVMIPHRALSNYVQQGGHSTPFNMNVTPSDKVLLLFSVSFDACTGVMFSTFCNGGTLILSSTSNFAHDVSRCSILPATPSILSTLQSPELYGNVRAIYLGGEAPNRALIAAWQSPTRRIFNCYGPTETTCASLIAELHADFPITLGLPMSNSEVFLLNADMDISLEGEIWISGPGLAAGYLGNSELTDQRFCDWKGTRIYRTGDIGRRTEHGLEYMGREDSQVKNRGFLINLEGQVVPALLNCPDVISATAMMYQGRLVGFVTPSGIDTQLIRIKLASCCDSFVVPDQIYSVHALPLTSNGKIDDRALKRSLDETLTSGNPEEATSLSELSTLRKALSITLSLPPTEIDNDCSFWELGGNSLAAIRLMSHLRTFSLSVPVAQLFQLKNLYEISQALVKEHQPAASTLLWGIESNDCQTDKIITDTPMTSVQLKMIRTSIEKPLVNYMLVSILINHHDQPLDTVRLRASWQAVLQRHSIFRTSYDMIKGVQTIEESITIDWQETSVSAAEWDMTCNEKEQEIHSIVRARAQAEAGLTLINPSTIFRLISIMRERSRILLMLHHSRVDGWSMGVILEEIQAILDGEMLPHPPQFSEVCLSQANIIRTRSERARKFWSEKLRGHLPPTPLSLPKPDQDVSWDSASEQSVRLDISPAHLEMSARSLKLSSATIFYTAWAILLSSYCSTDRVTFGTVFSGREIPVSSVQQVVGPLINTCPLPVHVDSATSASELLSVVQRDLFEMNELQWSANDEIGTLAPSDQKMLFDTVVALQYDLPHYQWKCRSVPGPWQIERHETSEFNLTVLVEREDDGLVIRIIFDPYLFKESSITEMLAHFSNLISACLDSKTLMVDDLRKRMLDKSQHAALIQHSSTLNDPYKGTTSLKDAFEKAVDEWSGLKAVETVEHSMSYRELDQASNTIACHLTSVVAPGDVVAIVSDASLMWVVSILSVVKTGAIYCPIDINLSQHRAEVILSESKASLCLIPNAGCRNAFTLPTTLPFLLIEETLKCSSTRTSHRLISAVPSKPEDTVCLVFTSGSTGKPKGVQANHLGILSYISFPPARLHACAGRRNAQLFSVGFDACTAEVFGTLCYGATLVLKDPSNPFAHLRLVDATMATPSFLSTCRLSDYGNLDTILLGGEAISQSLADDWSKGRRLYNGYGPCECTVGSMFALLSPSKRVTCGRPIPRTTAYILDESQYPVPVGVTGEIYLSGIQVTKGYFNLEAENRVSFLANPFDSTQRMYRTGDLGRWTESMELEFLGRKDSQVKVRGYRIELQEIERTILETDLDISNAVVIVREDTLLAFVTPDSIHTKRTLDKIREILPNYSRPSHMIALAGFPMSVNQKVDRKALAELYVPRSRITVKPSTKTEATLIEIWLKVLGEDRFPELSVEDDFLEIGGHSLLQIKVGRSISEKFQCAFPLGLVIRNPILSQLAKAIDNFNQQAADNYTTFIDSSKVDRKLDLDLSYLEEDMLLHHLISDTRSIFNISHQEEFEGECDLTTLEEAVNHTLAGNEIFRSRFEVLNGKAVRHISSSMTPVQSLPSGFWHEHVIQRLVNQPFDLRVEQPIRAFILEEKQKSRLLLVMHHIIVDKAALTAILEAIQTTYARMVQLGENGYPVPSGDNTDSRLTYVDWVDWTKKRVLSPDRFFYWQSKLRGSPSPPFSRDVLPYGLDAGVSISSTMGEVLCRSIRSTCERLYVTPNHLILAATALTIRAVTNCADCIISIPYLDRYENGTSNLIGLLLDRQPVLFQMSSALVDSAENMLAYTKNTVQEARENYIPFSEIRKAAGRSHLFDVMVTYHSQGDAVEAMQLSNCTTRIQHVKPEGAKFPLLFEFVEKDDKIEYEIEYKSHLFKDSHIMQIRDILHSACETLCQLQRPADITCDLALKSSYHTYESRKIEEPAAVSQEESKITLVREAFSHVLGLETTQVGCGRSFFDLGGSSILALQVLHFLRVRGCEVRLAQILSLESAEKIAACCKD